MKTGKCRSIGKAIKTVIKANLGMLVAVLTSAAQAAPGAVQELHGNVPEAVSPLTAIGRLAATNELRLAICLPLRNQGALSNLLQQIYDPANPAYHHYLTPDQFTEQFGPTESDYQAVIAFVKANGLKVTDTYPNRTLLDVSGKVPDIEKAFHVTMWIYPHPQEARMFYAPDVEPSLDLAVPVSHISGLDNYSLPRPRLQVRSPQKPDSSAFSQSGAGSARSETSSQPNAGSGPSGTYMARDFRAAYVPGTPLNGSGQAVGLLQFDGYAASDITYYIATNSLSSVTLSNVLLDGFSGTPTGNGGEVEVCLDIEMTLSMAPGISTIYVYEAGPSGLWHDILNRMANDNLAKQLSCSWYIPGGAMDTVADGIFQQMAAQGQSFYSASGDYDAFCGLIPFPGDTPYITEVGGTLLNTVGPGGAWTSETAWNRNNGIGSGGGISTQYAIPTWQQGLSMVANLGSTTMRNVPDVALTADYVYVRADGFDQNVGGTSAAAPLWAGFTALVNQQAAAFARPAVGFVNPAIYALGQTANYGTAFHDITVGNNTNTTCGSARFPAVVGYDLATGWGSPTTALINALANPDALSITPLTGFTSSGGAGGPFTTTSLSLTLTNAGTNVFSWSMVNTSLWLTVSPSGGTLTPGGASATVMASLNSVASNLVAGSYSATVWFTNLNSNVGQSRQFTLSIISPPTITLQPTNQTVLDGATATFTVGTSGGLPLYYQWQANSNNLTDGTHISGSATSTLVINNVSPADAASYRVVVTNAAGATVSSNALLNALPGNVDHFTWNTISATQVFNAPFGVSITARDTVNVTATNFSGAVNITGSGNGSGSTSNLVIQTSASIINSVVGILNNLGYHYTFVQTNIFTGLNLSNYNTIILGMDGGLVDYASMAYLATAVNAGAKLILLGGTAYQPFASGLNDFFIQVNTNNYSWTTVLGSPDLSVTAPGNPLAAGIPLTYSFLNHGATYYMARVTDGSAVTVATNGDGFACLATKTVGAGGVVMFINSVFDAYWNNPADSNVLSAIISNALQWNGAGGGSPIPVTPTASGNFVNGLWNGNVTVLQAATNVVLTANDGAGHSGSSNPFSVIYSNQPPIIMLQPTNQTLPVGFAATFTLSAAGSPPLSYYWARNGTFIAGATNSSYTTNNVQLTDSGSQFSCVVSNAYGTTNSQVATLTILALPPSITQQPTNQTVLVGGTASFSVTATGSLPLSYFWMRNGTAIAGATNSSYTTNNVQLTDSGSQFSCVVSNAYGTTNSQVATLTVVTLPTDWFTELFGTSITNLAFTTYTFTPNGSANFYAVCSQPAVAFPTDPTGGTALSEGDDTYVQITLSGTNTVAIYNNRTNVIYVGSNGYLTMNAGDTSLSPTYASHFSLPRVSAVYRDLNPGAGGTVTWKQLADRIAVSYQAVPIFGSSTQTNSFQVEMFFDGRIRLTYLNLNTPTGLVGLSAGTGQPTNFVASDYTIYTSCGPQPPVISLQPASQTIPAGGNVTFSVSASGTTPLSYFWQRNGTTIAGATNSSYTTNNVQLADSGSQFSCVVSNAYGTTNSQAATLTVLALPPSITQQPANQTVPAGGAALFSVVATGSLPLGYSWQRNGTAIAGATNSSYTTNNVQLADSGSQFSCLVSNAYGTALSSNATLTVLTGPVFLTGNYLYLPIQTNGVFLAANTGAKYNSAGTGGASGVDFWEPGTPVYNYIVGVGGINYLNGSAPVVGGFASLTVSNLSSGALQRALINGVVIPGLNFTRDISFANNSKIIRIVDTLQNTGATALMNVVTLDTADPDQDYVAAGTYATLNDVVSVNLNNDMVVASGPDTGLSVGFGSDSGLQIPSAVGFNNTDAYSLLTVVDPNGAEADIDINLAQNYGILAAGQSRSVVWYIVFGSSKMEVTNAFATINTNPPSITSQPVGVTVPVGNNATFTVGAIGAAPLSYFWQRNSVFIAGGTNSTYTTNNVQLIDSGSQFSCLVSNAYGTTNSQAATLTVLALPPSITQQPANQTVSAGGTASFSVTATGSLPLSYFWMRNGTAIAGATNSVYSTNNVQLADSGSQFSCLVSNAYGTVLSSPATLTVSVGCGSPIVINFDDVSAPASFSSTMRLTNQYASLGVTFAGPGGLDGGAILNSNGNFGVTGFSVPNFLAFNTNAPLSGGGIPRGPETIYFSQPMNYVSLRAGSGLSVGQNLTVSAYNISNVLLTASTITLASALTNVQVVGNGISSVVVSSPAPIFVLDDLTFVTICSCTPQSNYVASQTFLDGLTADTMGIASDGTNYWSVSGGYTTGNRLAQYDASGNLLATFAPGLDFRSIFTDATGAVYARTYSSSTIYRQTAPGVFAAQVTLSGGTLDAQSSVVLNASGTEFIAMSGGTVSRWSTNGTYIGTVSLSGFGTSFGENIYPQSRGIAVSAGYWLTYNTNQMLSFWDTSGNRVAQAALQNAGTNFDSAFSLSYCNGKVFVVDNNGGTWRGYQLCASGVAAAPNITQQPANQTLPVGSTAAFSVMASGASPISYFWRRNGSFIAGATNSSYSTNNVQLTDTGSQFSCLVSNAYGTVVSSNAVLTVSPLSSLRFAVLGAPDISSWNNDVQAKILAANPAAPVDIISVAAGSPTPTLAQLQAYNAIIVYSDAAFADAVGLGNVLANYVDAGGGVVVATFGFNSDIGVGGRLLSGGYLPLSLGSQTSGIEYTLLADLPLHQILTGVTSFDGGTASFHEIVTLQSNAVQVAHWSDGQPLVATKISGPGHVVGLNFYPPSQSARSDFWLTNTAGGLLLANSLLWSSGGGAGSNAPSITSQPAGVTVPAGSTATFTVGAAGTWPLSYFWQRNGVFITGGTNSSYTTNNVQLTDSGSQFSCVVSNAYGTTNSQVATLTVVALPPSITQQPTNQMVPVGGTATFTVGASGTAPLSYFWKRNGSTIPGANASSYTLTNVQVADSGSQFSCVVTNIAGVVTSSVAVLKVDTTVANDQCSGALVISGLSYTNAQYTTNATSIGDPVPDCITGFGNGVWYRFTPAFSGQLELDTFGSDFDTGLALYTGSCGALAEVACNDDTGGLQSQIITTASAGTTYYILAGGYSGYTGHLLIHLALALPVDHFAWNTIPATATKNVPFGVTVTAQDVLGHSVSNFAGAVTLSASAAGGAATNRMMEGLSPASSSSGTYTWGYPFTPTNNLTVTHVSSYFGTKVSLWTGSGVLLSTQNVSGPIGVWTETALSAPVSLVAGSNYVVAAYVSASTYYWLTSLSGAFADGAIGTSLYTTTDAFPTNADVGAWPLVGLRYTVGAGQAVAITPTTAGLFVSGAWTGNLTVLQVATNVVLLANDGLGHSGSSNPFQVVSSSMITHVTLLPGGIIQITLAGSSGDIYRVLGSTNLTSWQTIASVTNVTGTVQFTDFDATNYNRRFYRLVMP